MALEEFLAVGLRALQLRGAAPWPEALKARRLECIDDPEYQGPLGADDRKVDLLVLRQRHEPWNVGGTEFDVAHLRFCGCAGIAWRDSAVEERGINLDWFTGESCENRFSSYNPRGGEAPSGDLAPDGAAPVSHTIGWLLRRDTLRVVADGLVRGHFSKQHTPDRSGRDNRQLILDLSASAGQVIEITQVRFSLGREALSLREQVAAQAAARPARLELVADATPSDLLREQETSYTRKMEVKENRLEVSSSDTASYGGNWNSTLAIPSRLLQAINERLPGQAVMLEVTSQVLGANPKGLSQLQLNCHTTPFSADVSLAFDARQPGWNFHFHGQEPLMSGPIIGAPSRGHTWGLLLRNDSAHVYVDDRPQGRWVSVRPWLQAVQKGGMSRLELELEGQRPEIIVVHTVRVYGQDETRVVAARKAAAEALATKQEAEKHARLLAEAQTRQAAEQASRLAAEKRAAEERAASSSASRSSYSSSSGSSSSSSGGISFSRADMSAFSKTTVCLALLRADNTIRSIECFEYPSGTSKAEAVQRARNSLGISEETGVYYSTSSCGTASESAKSYFRNAGGYRTTVTCH